MEASPKVLARTQPHMIPIGPRETSRMVFRIELLKRRGASEQQAEEWSDTLARRDWLKDDRRSCWECENLTRSGACFAQQQGWIKHAPQKDRLWRCEAFGFQKP